MNIAYLIFMESISSVLVRRQAGQIIVGLRKRIEQGEYYLLWFLPWTDLFRKRNDVKDGLSYYKKNNIKCKLIPIPFPLPRYSFKKGWHLLWSYNVIETIFLLLYSLPILIYYKIARDVRLFHARGYPISLTALIIRLVFRKTKFIFDPRSDFPEENAFRRGWTTSNINFKMWKYFEKLYCKYADKTIAIGEVFGKNLDRLYEKPSWTKIHNNVETDKFRYNNRFRKEYRKRLGLEDKIVFCYSGSLQAGFWNDPEPYVRFIASIWNLCPFEIAFLFLIPSWCRVVLADMLEKYHIAQSLVIMEHPGADDVPDFLSVGDIALYFLPFVSPRVGTKFVEYCSVGLPTIVNENVLGAAKLIEEFGLGACIGNEVLSGYEKYLETNAVRLISEFAENREYYQRRCRAVTINNFDNQRIADQYLEVYEELLVHKW